MTDSIFRLLGLNDKLFKLELLMMVIMLGGGGMVRLYMIAIV